MDLYDRMLNIKNISVESVIKQAINKTKEELNTLSYERMCLVYSSYLYNNLKSFDVLAYIVDTTDLGYSYKHQFIIVFNTDKTYLLDLTFKQFQKEESFSKLYNEGYQEIDDSLYASYLSVVTKELTDDINISSSIINNRKALGK